MSIDETSLPPYPFPGPEPIMEAPDEPAVIKAEISLTQALHPDNNGQHPKGISEKDADILLQWVVQYARGKLANIVFGSEKKFREADSALGGQCRPVQNILSYALEKLGLKPCQPDTYSFYSQNRLAHYYTVLHMPIMQPDGSVLQTPYLIDPTYRQFFDPAIPVAKVDNGTFLGTIDNAGVVITRTLQGRKLANTLLSDGYVKLDEEKAKLYLNSLANGQALEGSYLEKLFAPENDKGYQYSKEDLEKHGVDVRSPLWLIREGAKTRNPTVMRG